MATARWGRGTGLSGSAGAGAQATCAGQACSHRWVHAATLSLPARRRFCSRRPHLRKGQHKYVGDIVGNAPREVRLAVCGLGCQRLQGRSSTHAAGLPDAAARRSSLLLLHRAPEKAGAARQQGPHDDEAPRSHVCSTLRAWYGPPELQWQSGRQRAAAAVSGRCRTASAAGGSSQTLVQHQPKTGPAGACLSVEFKSPPVCSVRL